MKFYEVLIHYNLDPISGRIVNRWGGGHMTKEFYQLALYFN